MLFWYIQNNFFLCLSQLFFMNEMGELEFCFFLFEDWEILPLSKLVVEVETAPLVVHTAAFVSLKMHAQANCNFLQAGFVSLFYVSKYIIKIVSPWATVLLTTYVQTCATRDRDSFDNFMHNFCLVCSVVAKVTVRFCQRHEPLAEVYAPVFYRHLGHKHKRPGAKTHRLDKQQLLHKMFVFSWLHPSCSRCQY